MPVYVKMSSLRFSLEFLVSVIPGERAPFNINGKCKPKVITKLICAKTKCTLVVIGCDKILTGLQDRTFAVIGLQRNIRML